MENITYLKVVEEGDAETIGFQRGRLVKQMPGYYHFLSVPDKGMPILEAAEAEKELMDLSHVDSSLAEECHAFASGIGQPLEKLAFLQRGIKNPRGCSVLGIAASRSKNGHPLLVRSYEFGPEDEFIYSITREKGCYSHVGFSLFQSGRFEGINEKGLAIASTSLEFFCPSREAGKGLSFAFLVRILLDRCASVKECLSLIHSVPVGDNCTLLMMDSSGDMALLENVNAKNYARKAIRLPKDGILYGLNHCIDKDNAKVFPKNKYFSFARQTAIDTYFSAHDKVNVDEMKSFLSAPIPTGLSCNALSSYFGTLRSVIFDLADSTMTIRLGAPDSGNWFTADFHEKVGITSLKIPYRDEKKPLSFWRDI